MEGVGVRECDDEPEEDVEAFLNGRRREMERGLGHEFAAVLGGGGGATAAAAAGSGSRSLAGRGMGDEPTLEFGEYSLGVAVRGVEEAETDVEDDALLELKSWRCWGRTREVTKGLSGCGRGSSSPSSVMRTARRGSGRGAKRMRGRMGSFGAMLRDVWDDEDDVDEDEEEDELEE